MWGPALYRGASRWVGKDLHAVFGWRHGGACGERVAWWWVLRTALGVASGQVGVMVGFVCRNGVASVRV